MTGKDSVDHHDTAPGVGKRSKVERVIGSYNLKSFGEKLERFWVDQGDDRMSLRELADYFNCQVLETAIEETGEKPIDGEIENLYRLMTADDVTASERTQAETRLSRRGIDVEKVKRDFVSHQAVHTYLTKVRGASLPSDEPSPDAATANRREAILRLRNRLVAVAKRTLDSLRHAGHLSLGEFEVMVGITVYCIDCGASVQIIDLFDQGGCDCRRANK